MNLGTQKVKAWRRAQRPRLTQAVFAERFGLAAITWSRIECGYALPPLTVAVKLEQAGICAASDWFADAGADRPTLPEPCADLSDDEQCLGEQCPVECAPACVGEDR